MRRKVEVPKALVEGEIERLRELTRQDLAARGIPVKDDTPLPAEMFEQQAQRRVNLGLILAELVKAHQLQAKPEQVRAAVEEQAQSYEHPQEVVRWYYQQPERLREIESMALEDNVVEWALTNGEGRGQADRIRRIDGEQDNETLFRAAGASSIATRHDRTAGPGARADGDRAERPRRARLRHLLAAAEGARGVPGRPGERGDRQPDRRAAPVSRIGESRQGHFVLHQLARRLGVGGTRDLRHDAVRQARRVHAVRRPGGEHGRAAARGRRARASASRCRTRG